MRTVLSAVVCAMLCVPRAWCGEPEDALRAGYRAAAQAAAAEAPAASAVPRAGPVRELKLSAAYRCVGGEYRYAVGDVSSSYGPDLSAATDGFDGGYLYPSQAGYRVVLEGDGPGARVFLESREDGARLAFAAVAPLDNRCPVEGAAGLASVRLSPDPSVRAALERRPRTGIFRPPCYKNVTTGDFVLELWITLRLAWSDRTVELTTPDSADFGDRGACLDFYRGLAGSAGAP